MTRRVVLIGPECSGKTSLARGIAHELGAVWLAEAARRFAESTVEPLSSATVEPIARLAMRMQDEALAARPALLICDTDLVSTVVYGRHYYGATPEWIVREAVARRADLYLLCRPDLPWRADGVRDRPTHRQALFELFRDELERMDATYAEIGGLGDSRQASALAAIATLEQGRGRDAQ